MTAKGRRKYYFLAAGDILLQCVIRIVLLSKYIEKFPTTYKGNPNENTLFDLSTSFNPVISICREYLDGTGWQNGYGQ